MKGAGAMIFVEEAQKALRAMESGQPLSEDTLMVTCQNLVTWASRFDPERHGPDAYAPSESEREAAMTAIETLSTLIQTYESSLADIRGELKEKHHSRRALSGYGCIKSAATHSQFINRKI